MVILRNMKRIVLNCEYVQGHLRGGHLELELDDTDYEKFQSLPKEEQLEWAKEGDMHIDSYRVEDYMTEDHFDVIDT